MIVRVAPLGEVVKDVNVPDATTVSDALNIAGVSVNDRSIMVNQEPAQLDTVLGPDSSGACVVTLATKMKGGR